MDIWVPCANKEVMGLAETDNNRKCSCYTMEATRIFEPQGYIKPCPVCANVMGRLSRTTYSQDHPNFAFSEKKENLGYHTRQGTLTNEILNRRKGAVEGLIMEKENSKQLSWPYDFSSLFLSLSTYIRYVVVVVLPIQSIRCRILRWIHDRTKGRGYYPVSWM